MPPVGQPSVGAQVDLDNPWPGLESYDESSQDYFSGRAAETDELQRRIVDEPITVLFGKSGLGKTSLLKAGVFPRLREKGLLPIFLRLQVRAGTEPFIEQARLALLDELRAQEIDHPDAKGQTLWEYLHRTGHEFWTRQNRLVRPVFVFDQFEELFTLGRAVPTGVAAFREDLADLAENRIPDALASRLDTRPADEQGLDLQAMPYKIVISLREDFLADLEGWRLTMPSLRRNRMRLLPMGPQQALQAVCNDRTKHLVPEPLGRRIVGFLSSGPATGDAPADDGALTVEPALLSLFCRGVNEHRKRDGKARFDEALLEGAKETIVTDFYRTSLADQPERVRRFIAEELITEHGFRNSYSVDDALARDFVTAKELQTLINRHLLRQEHHLGTERIELTHDLLTRAVVEERNERRLAERGRRQWQKMAWTVGVSAGIVLGCLLAVIWVVNKNNAIAAQARRADEASKRSRSKELAAFAVAALSKDPELAVRLALEGLQEADTNEARSALLDAAQYVWPSAVLDEAAVGGKPDAVTLSPDGRRLAVLAAGRTITLWNVDSREPARVWPTSSDLDHSSSLAFSPDQKLLAVGRKTSIDLLDPATGRVVKTMTQSAVDDRRIAFSPDGRWLGWIENTQEIRLLDHQDAQAKPVRVRAPGVLSFSILGGGQRIVFVTDHPLSARASQRQPDGRWGEPRTLDLSECTTPQSVSPGAESSSATWRAQTCTIGKEADGRFSQRDDKRPTFDIVWSSGGHAAAEILASQDVGSQKLVLQDVIVGGTDVSGTHLESHIKGAQLSDSETDRSRVVSVNELGTRLALIHEPDYRGGERGKRIKIYSVANNKPILGRLRKGSFAVAPDGGWIAVARPVLPGEATAAIDVVPIGDVFSAGARARARTTIEVDTPVSAIHATQSAVVAVLSTTPPKTVVLDAVTGKPRSGPHVGTARLVGASGELLLIDPPDQQPGQLIKTIDGSPVASWEQAPGGPPVFIVSASGEALAVLRVQVSDPTRADALVYAVRGESLAPSGQVIGIPATPLSTLPRRLRLADDARSITEIRRTRNRAETFVWPVTGTRDPAPAVPVKAKAAPASPQGRFEVQRESMESGGVPIFRVVRRADGSVLKRFRGSVRHHFSHDDRWLVVQNEDGIHVLDLTRGEIAFDLNPGQADASFEAGNKILNVQTEDDALLVPLDLESTTRFVAWLNPRALTREERCMYELGGTECQKEIVAPRVQSPSSSGKPTSGKPTKPLD